MSPTNKNAKVTIPDEESLPPGWKKEWSKSQKRWYYFHNESKSSQWSPPTSDLVNHNSTENGTDKKRKQHDENQIEKKQRLHSNISSSSSFSSSSHCVEEMQQPPKVAIIVPFRDLHVEQRRREHMNQFVPYMTEYLSKEGIDFHVYIVEQTNDGKKFNRGKLLNCGYDIAKENYNVFIFHDVDLLPDASLTSYYSTIPNSPMHIARVWNRYNNNNKYFGGIVSFNKADFESINGYPNNFWGWGGEDDELFKRVQACRLRIQSPKSGSIKDLEDMNLQDKLNLLKKTDWKCMVKWELLKEHSTTWKKNGLSDLTYDIEKTDNMNENASKVTVHLHLNKHWSDEKTTY